MLYIKHIILHTVIKRHNICFIYKINKDNVSKGEIYEKQVLIYYGLGLVPISRQYPSTSQPD
jgi:hypothetical protein